MLRTRLITAAILVPVVLAVIALGEAVGLDPVGALIFLGFVELISLLDAGGFEPPQMLVLIVGVAVTGVGLLVANEANVSGLPADLLGDDPAVGAVVVGVCRSCSSVQLRGIQPYGSRQGVCDVGRQRVRDRVSRDPRAIHRARFAPGPRRRVARTATIVGPLGLHSGAAWGLLLVLVVWGYDTGAFLTGRWLGRTRLISHISPSKTVEGLVGGLVVATVAAGLGGWVVGLQAWHRSSRPLIGLTAQAGDLAESMLKRAADRKESGFLFPGHGGVLDRIDSFLFAAPVLAGYALLMAGSGWCESGRRRSRRRDGRSAPYL